MKSKTCQACFVAAFCILATSQALLLPEQYTQVGKKVVLETSRTSVLIIQSDSSGYVLSLREIGKEILLAPRLKDPTFLPSDLRIIVEIRQNHASHLAGRLQSQRATIRRQRNM